MQREYPQLPQVGVGVIVWRGDACLLVRRSKPPRAGEWSLPGGRQRLGETIVEAARREVQEETTLIVEVTDVVTVVDLIEHDQSGHVRFHYVLVDVNAEWIAGEARAGSDAAAIAWIELDALVEMRLWSETERVIRLAAARRGR